MILAKGPEAAPIYRRWRDRFADAIDERFYGIEYLDYLILGRGVATIHAGDTAAIVTEFKFYPNCKVVHGLVAAGDIDEIVNSLIPMAEAWARNLGCTQAIVESRPGWQRALRKNGYELHQIAVVKGL